MEIGVVTHFSQGWSLTLLQSAAELGADMIRDSVSWARVETTRSVYDFSHNRVSYVDAALAAGLGVSLVFQPENSLYDGGNTVRTKAAVVAFADFVVATLERFDGVARIEIGNEFNSANFVSGRVLSDGLQKRAQYYSEILEAVAQEVRPRFPDVEIVGGAMHSIPVGYALRLAEAGALAHLDAIAIHPYTTDPERVADEIALLRRVTGDLSIHVTEFGQQPDVPADNASYLVKMVVAMAAAGVDAAQWYALYEQRWFRNMELVNASRNLTPAGEAYGFLSELLADGGSVERLVSPSDIYFYRIGMNAMVLWGEPQEVAFTVPVRVYDATGKPVVFRGVLDGDAPLIVVCEEPLVVGQSVILKGTGRIAHSYHDFDVDDSDGFDGPWSYFELAEDGGTTPLSTALGQEKQGEPWVPHLSGSGPIRVTAEQVLPHAFGTKPSSRVAVLERMTVTEDALVTIAASWNVQDTSEDGVTVDIRLNGESLFSDIVFDQSHGHEMSVTLTDVEVRTDDYLDFIVFPRELSTGPDLTERVYDIVRQTDGGTPTGAKLLGTPRDDVLHVSEGDVVDAGEGRDTAILADMGFRFDLAASNVERVKGGAGDDVLDGSGGTVRQRLDGNGGDDTLIGGAGNDFMKGGDGFDLFVIGRDGGRDVVHDFDPAHDTLLLEGVAAADFAALMSAAYETANGFFIDLGEGDSVILVGHDASVLDTDAIMLG